MYDALVALRTGWGREEFATAGPDLTLAMRAAIYAERVSPLYVESKAAMELDPAAVPVSERVKVNRARMDARDQLAALRARLRMDDFDG